MERRGYGEIGSIRVFVERHAHLASLLGWLDATDPGGYEAVMSHFDIVHQKP